MSCSLEFKTYRLGDIVNVVDYVANGSFATLKENVSYLNSPGYAMLVRTTDFNNQWNGNYVWVDKKAYEFLSKTALNQGDLVLSNVGSVGVVFEVPKFAYPMTLGPNSVMLRSTSTELIQKFLYYYFVAPQGQKLLRSISTGSVQAKFNKTDLRNSLITLPNVEVQKKAATALTALDDRITLLRETNKTLEAIAQALFKSWFVDFDPVRAKMEGRQPEGMDEATAALFPDSFEESELGMVPKGWRILPFLEVCEMQGGAQPPASVFIDEQREGYVRLLQIRDFSTDAHKTYVPLEKKLKTATDDDVLIGRYGSASGDKDKDSLGRVCRGLSGAYNVALMKLAPLLVGREFALQLVDDPRFYQYLQGVSSKAVQSGFSKKELAQYKVVVPSSDLCEKYEILGSLIWKRSKEIKKQIEILSNLRDTLLPRLISGQLRLPDAEAEIEAHTA